MIQHLDTRYRHFSSHEMARILETALFLYRWQKSEQELEYEGNFPTIFFEELRGESNDFLMQISQEFNLSRRDLVRAKSALNELILNGERHMHAPFYFSLAIAYSSDESIIIHTENSAQALSIEKAEERIIAIMDSFHREDETSLARLRKELLEAEGDGGLGLWNLMTQLGCYVRVYYDPDTGSGECFCVIPKGV